MFCAWRVDGMAKTKQRGFERLGCCVRGRLIRMFTRGLGSAAFYFQLEIHDLFQRQGKWKGKLFPLPLPVCPHIGNFVLSSFKLFKLHSTLVKVKN